MSVIVGLNGMCALSDVVLVLVVVVVSVGGDSGRVGQ
jgi:hypothetical protein